MTLKKTIFTALSAFALLAGGTLAVGALSGSSATAQAQSAKSIVDGAKSKGVIGETIAGYLAETGLNSASSAEKAAMDEINIRRKTLYTRLARSQNVQPEEVAKLTGEKQVSAAPSGEKVMDESGTWRTK